MSDTILVKSRPCTVCGEYEVWSLDRQAVTSWQEGENIQNAFPDMNAEDREILISGTHPACWDKLFPEEEGTAQCTRCEGVEEADQLIAYGDMKLCEACEGDL